MYKRSFDEPEFSIIVVGHSGSRDSKGLLDQLAIIQLDGDQAKAGAFLEQLKARYVGKPLDEWLSE